ncbi:MAG: hypothetical protein SNJ63_05615 [Sphingomonadaceae bacterium]
MERQCKHVAGFLGLTAALATAIPVQAEEQADRAFQLTPYVWAAGIGGTAQPLPGGPTLRVSRSFGDLLDDLDAAFFVTGLARLGVFVTLFDASRSVSSREGLVTPPVPGLPTVPAEGRLAQTSFTLMGGVRAVDLPGISIDLLAGVRAWWIRTRIEAPALGVVVSPDESFADPVLGSRLNFRLADGWSILLQGDFGGFGAGSEFTTQVATTLNARVARQIWVSAGYRYLMVDYEGSRSTADLRMAGPLIGATVAF